jgi:hypothetical protein
MNRTLSHRLERLESRFVPPEGVPTEHTIVLVDADGTETEFMTMRFSPIVSERTIRERASRQRLKRT